MKEENVGRQSLERRPEDKWDGPSKMISGNTFTWHQPEPQWVPGGLPPVGSKLMIKATSQNCEIVCKYRNGVVYYVFATEKFAWTDSDRIFISHRDKVIEAAEQHIPVRLAHKTKDLRVIFSDLYDYGMLKLPEGE